MKTLCILTAGKGVRLNKYSTLINKALLPVNKKAAVSHIIDNFPVNTKLVVALGHLGSQVKDFLKLYYPKRKIKFVNIKNYSGKKSGPGKSLLECKKYIDKDFYFVSCDTLWKSKINTESKNDWMGVSKKLYYDPINYCNILSKNKKIINIKNKVHVSKNYKHFIGLAYIKNYEKFWQGLDKMKKDAGEYQVIDGFKYLIKVEKVSEKVLEWYDIGTYKNYNFTLQKYEKFNFRKTSEFIYIDKDKITKFFGSRNKLNKLKFRSKQNKSFPKFIKTKKQFIQYKYIEGDIYYKKVNQKNFKKFLFFLEKKLWTKKSNTKIDKLCKNFYFKKTLQRINLYLSKYNIKKDFRYKINNIYIPPVNTIFKKIPWNKIFNGIPSSFHGDLQFDNVIYDGKKFSLIDWREDFGGNINLGDIYYDFAKIYGGIEMNYDLIKKGKFTYKEKSKEISYYFKSRKLLMNTIKKEFMKYLLDNNFSIEKVEIIKSLIYLNMSPLHEYPFDKLLFSHGKYELYKALKIYGYIN